MYKRQILISRKRTKRGRSTPNGIIARLYTSSRQKKLASYRWGLTSLKTFDSCNEQPYVRTQLAIAKSYKLACTEQPYVRMQQERIAMLVKESSLTSLKTFDSCNEQPYERTQLAIATSRRMKLASCRWLRTQLAIATSQKQVKYRKNDPSTEKTNAGALSQAAAGHRS